MEGSHPLSRKLALALAALSITLGAAVTTAEAQRTYRGEPGPRLRLGAEASLGAAVGDTKGGAFSLAGQLGLQANHLFGIYWKPALYVDGWANDEEGLDTYTFTSQLAMADFTFAHWFQIGGGAGVDIGRLGVCEGSGCEMRSGQVKPAIEGRLAFILPLYGRRVRWGIPIVFTGHTTFLGGERIHSLTVGTGILRF
jgi:hypothetical protein